MAQIKLGGFGNVTPGRAPQVSMPAGAFGAGQAQALERLGQVGSGIVTQELDRQKAQAEAVARAKEAAALHEAEDKLRDLHDEIGNKVATGEVPRDAAEGEFTKRAQEAVGSVMPRFRDFNREVVAPRLDRQVATLGNSMRRIVEKRGRQEVTGAINQSLEYFERLYRTDPQAAEAGAASLLKEMGPWSDLTPDQVAKTGQGWREKAQFTTAYEAVSASRRDKKGLAEAEKLINALPDLDPQKRAVLVDRAQAYSVAIDMAAERAAVRAERERDRTLKRAEHSFNAFQALADKGTALDPDYMDRVLKETAGTPYAAAIKGLAEQARVTGGLAAQPIAAQRAALDQINAEIAQRGRSPETDHRKEQAEKVLRSSEQDVERDALRAGLERGVITELAPLNLAGGIQGALPQLAARVDAAQRVQQWAGKPVSPLTDDEAAGLKQRLDALPVKERSGMVAVLARSVGPDGAQGLAAQLGKTDKALALAIALAGSTTTEGRYTSELVLKGQQARTDGTSTKGEKQPDVKATAWKAHAAAELDGVFANQQTAGQIRDAAELIMHGIAAEKGGRLTRDDMDRAVRLALGGSLVEHNGRKIPLPAGLDEDGLARRLESITVEEISRQALVPRADGQPQDVSKLTVRAGGVDVSVAEFLQSLPAQQLMPVRPGQFAVLVGGRPVVNAAGKPILVKVK